MVVLDSVVVVVADVVVLDSVVVLAVVDVVTDEAHWPSVGSTSPWRRCFATAWFETQIRC